MKLLKYLIPVLLSSWLARADNFETLDLSQVSTFSNYMPASFLDHSGFQLPEGHPLAIPGLDPFAPVFPMFPVFRNHFGRSENIGAVIPEKYLGLQVVPNNMVIINRGLLDNPTVEAAVEMIKDAGLQPQLLNNRLFALDPKAKIESVAVMNRTTTGGLSLLNPFDRSNHLVVGNQKSYFILDPEKTFSQMISSMNILLRGDNRDQVVEATLKYAPYLRYYLSVNSVQDGTYGPALPATPRADLTLDSEIHPLPVPVATKEFTYELRTALTDLQKGLKTEVTWRKRVEREANAELIYNSLEANRLIQDVCDALAQAYSAPQEVWPRCRIAASLVPNAYAMPGGDIFITAGLIGLMSNLGSIDYVLGHEIGHVVGRHLTHAMDVGDVLNRSLNGISFAGSMFSLMGGAGYAGNVTLLSWYPKAMAVGQATGLALQAVGLGAMLGWTAYSREHEWQADRFGQQAALALGTEIGAVLQGGKEILDFDLKYFPDKIHGGLFADHPDWEKRTAELASDYKKLQHLSVDYAKNRHPEAMVQQYAQLHELFAPYVQAFGEAKGKAAKDKHRLAYEYMQQSQNTPGSSCALYALTGLQRY